MSNPNPANWRKSVNLKKHKPPRQAFTPAVVVAPSIMAKAEHYAQNVQEIHAGIYRVGYSTVSAWHSSCTCASRRSNHKKPCVHQIAVKLSGRVITWGNLGRIYAALIKQHAHEKKPELLATYAKCKGIPKCNTIRPFKGGFYRILETSRHPRTGEPLFELLGANGAHYTAVRAQLHTLQPFFTGKERRGK